MVLCYRRTKNIRSISGREIEAAQLKESVDDFNVGDTVKVYGKIKEGNRE